MARRQCGSSRRSWVVPSAGPARSERQGGVGLIASLSSALIVLVLVLVGGPAAADDAANILNHAASEALHDATPDPSGQDAAPDAPEVPTHVTASEDAPTAIPDGAEATPEGEAGSVADGQLEGVPQGESEAVPAAESTGEAWPEGDAELALELPPVAVPEAGANGSPAPTLSPAPALSPAPTLSRPPAPVRRGAPAGSPRITALLPAVVASGWANPVKGRLTSPFGPRAHPILGVVGRHTGQDVANRCGTPIYAAAQGTVVWSGGALAGRTGNQLVIAHGGGVVTRYGHLLSGTVRVEAGDAVAAGQLIASMGGDAGVDPLGAGRSTGCHLHVEVNANHGLTPVDPITWFAARGVALGADAPGILRAQPAPAPAADAGTLTVTAAGTSTMGTAEGGSEHGPFVDVVDMTTEDPLAWIATVFAERPAVPMVRRLG